MAFGGQINTSRGWLDISDVLGLKLVDRRVVELTAQSGNDGSFTVPLGDFVSFNNSPNFRVFSYAALPVNDPNPGFRSLYQLMTYVDFPSVIQPNSVATVRYRGGSVGNYRFWTWIVEV